MGTKSDIESEITRSLLPVQIEVTKITIDSSKQGITKS